MLKQWERLLAWGLYATDIILTLASLAIAFSLRSGLPPSIYPPVPLERYLMLPLLVIPIWSILLLYLELYQSRRTTPLWDEIFAVFKVVFLGCLLLYAALFALRAQHVSRLFVAMFGLVNLLLMLAFRILTRTAVRYFRRRNYNPRDLLLVGTGEKAKELISVIETHRGWGLNLVGIVGDIVASGRMCGYKILGNIEDVPRLIHEHPIDEVIFCLPKSRLDKMEDLFLLLEDEGVSARIVMNFFPHVTARVSFEELSGIPFLTFSTIPTNAFLLGIKRGIDIALSLILLVVLSPLLLFVALMVRISSPGPILFRQTRSGLHGRKFAMYKFRSMCQDAEEMKIGLLDKNEMDGPVFKLRNDPRITRIGKLIRMTSIDELPQLWNVLKGDMSIVGPRPPLPSEVEHYERWQRRRLSMKPGLTCLWQINGRNKLGFKDWMRLDLQYIDNWSLILDLKILLRTIPVVLLGKGAV